MIPLGILDSFLFIIFLHQNPEMILKDEEPFCKWDDMKYVGSGIFGDIKEEKLTQEEIMNFAVDMREKKQKDTTIH
ncbi:hypothetical protein IEM_05424 [Bacillus cereus BAG6O-2]|nr:hypothetical protein IEM_05424 [Bacillus cereus BAG6O-2]